MGCRYATSFREGLFLGNRASGIINSRKSAPGICLYLTISDRGFFAESPSGVSSGWWT